MKVILTEDIQALGRIGEVVKVAPGYARNYLLPKGLALTATGKNVQELDHRKRILAQKREKVRQQRLSVAERLNQLQITVKRKVVEEDKLYGSLNVAEIARMLGEQGFEIDRKDIKLAQPIKELGTFPVPVRIDADITAEVKFVVEKED
jgi:large subunit ribosomal protein L9